MLNRCSSFARSLVPQCCLLCGAGCSTPMCRACDAALPRLPQARCRICALPIDGAGLEQPFGAVCGACLHRPPRYHRVSAAFVYAFPIDGLIHAFKYGGRLAIARPLGEALARTVAGEPADMIVPMPLSPRRLRERGFNQALEIARHVARATGIPVAAEACRRVNDTVAQASLPWRERARNIRGAFVCDADMSGRTVAVLDDVMTTGATLDEIAKNLRRAGAREVRGWMVTRALKHDAPHRAKL